MKSLKLPKGFTMDDMLWARAALQMSIGKLGLSMGFFIRLCECLGMNGRLPDLFDVFEAARSLNVYVLPKFVDGIGPCTCSALYNALVKNGFANASGPCGIDGRIAWLYEAVWRENQGAGSHGKWFRFYFGTP